MKRSFRRRVAFSETDASGRVHFTQIFKWVEDAEHQLLEEVGVTISDEETGWPRVGVTCDYSLPFSYGDEAEVELELAELGGKSLRWVFRVLKGQEIAAQGEMTTVCMVGGKPEVISDEVREKLSR